MVTAFGAGASAGSYENREISHHVTWGADLVLFSLVVWYVLESTLEKPGSSWWPVWLVTAGALLTMMDPTRHLLLDHDGVFIQPEAITMYNEEGGLSTVGSTCMYSTRFGLAMLVLGVTLFIKLPSKIAKLCSTEHV